MFIERFEVQGFKNFVEPVVIDDLGPVNVIHGDNNVGKSNLLEAMHLFFRLLAEDVVGRSLPFSRPTVLSDRDFRQTGYASSRVFNLYRPRPIRMNCTFTVSETELSSRGIESLFDCTRVTVGVELVRRDGAVAYRISRFEFADGTDATINDGSKRFAHRFALFLTRNYLAQDEASRPTFALVDETRAIRGLTVERPGGLLSAPLQLRLYDAKNSRDSLRFARWKLFTELLGEALNLSDDGDFDVLYDRLAGEAALFYQHDGIRMDLDLFGSGHQQVAALLGQLLTTDASFVAIEEPECNLRYALQVKVRDTLARIADDEAGPSQLFVTSHSPAFETGEWFYGMACDDGTPRLERRPRAEAPMFTGLSNAPLPPTADHARRSYVTGDGLVEVPPFVLEALELPDGGGVFFAVRREDGIVEMLSHRQFMKLGGFDDG